MVCDPEAEPLFRIVIAPPVMACPVASLFDGVSPARLRILFGDLSTGMAEADLAWWLKLVIGLCRVRCSCSGASAFERPGVFSISLTCIESTCEVHARTRPSGLRRVLPALGKTGRLKLVTPGMELPASERSPGALRSAAGATLGAVGWVASGAARVAYDALLGGLVALSLVSPEDVPGATGGMLGAGSSPAAADASAGVVPLKPGEDVVCVLPHELEACAASLEAALGALGHGSDRTAPVAGGVALLLRHPAAPWDAAAAIVAGAADDPAALCVMSYIGGASAPVSLPQLCASCPTGSALARLCDATGTSGQLTREATLLLIPHLVHEGVVAIVDAGGRLGAALLFGAAAPAATAAVRAMGAAEAQAEPLATLRLRICAASALVDLHSLRLQEAAALAAASAASRGADREAALRHLRRRHM